MSNQAFGTRKTRSGSVDIVQVARRAGVSPATVSSLEHPLASYDELSDNIPLTESLAMRELNELVRSNAPAFASTTT